MHRIQKNINKYFLVFLDKICSFVALLFTKNQKVTIQSGMNKLLQAHKMKPLTKLCSVRVRKSTVYNKTFFLYYIILLHETRHRHKNSLKTTENDRLPLD